MTRYGSIRYVNNLPVDHGLVTGKVPAPPGLSIVPGSPAELNTAMARRAVDVSAVSSVALLGAAHRWRLLPEATIASHGPVDSVLLVSRRPIDRLDDRVVAVSDQSATGALLLRIILERDVQVRPRYATAPSDLEAMLADHDAALLIGDDALRATARLGDDRDPLDGRHVLDLGEAWRAYSGHPMVYAVWVAHNDFADQQSAALSALRQALVASRRWGATNRSALVAEAHARTGVPSAVLSTYYSRLTYTLGTSETAGLRRFAEEVATLERRPAPPTLEPLEVLA